MASKQKNIPKKALLICLLLLINGISSMFGNPQEISINVQQEKDVRTQLVEIAKDYLGTPYRNSGTDKFGIDCSGLVCAVYKKVLDAELPRTVSALYHAGTPLPVNAAKPGDVVFFNTVGGISHAGIYIGRGRFIHAASAGSKLGVIRSSLKETYYKQRYLGAVRFLKNNEKDTEIASENENDKNRTNDLSEKDDGSILFENSDTLKFGDRQFFSGRYYDKYRVQLKKGHTYKINIVSENFPPRVFIQDGFEREIMKKEPEEGGSVQLLFRPKESDPYFILVSSAKWDSSGGYRITVWEK